MRYKINETVITCPYCQHDTFDKDYRQLNTKGATFFNMDWANREAIILVCQHCSHIAWFMDELEAEEE